jgi:hypothetical protein
VKDGDIDNTVTPRLLVVWEGLLAIPPDASEKNRFSTWISARKSGKTRTMIDSFDLNTTMAKHVWDVTWRRNYSVDVVTFLGVQYLPHIEAWIDRHDLPIGHVTNETPDTLARRLSYMPHVAAVYDPDPTRRYTYGGKGRLMNPEAPDFFGVK